VHELTEMVALPGAKLLVPQQDPQLELGDVLAESIG